MDNRTQALTRRAKTDPTPENVEALIRAGQRSGEWLGCEFGEHEPARWAQPEWLVVDEDHQPVTELVCTPTHPEWVTRCGHCRSGWAPVYWTPRPTIEEAARALGRKWGADRERRVMNALLARGSSAP